MSKQNDEQVIREAFRRHGMNPEQIRYNENLDYYHVNIGVEDTDERYLRDIHELGTTEAVTQQVNTDSLRSHASLINGSEVSGLRIVVKGMMKDAHFKVEIE